MANGGINSYGLIWFLLKKNGKEKESVDSCTKKWKIYANLWESKKFYWMFTQTTWHHKKSIIPLDLNQRFQFIGKIWNKNKSLL